VIGELESRQHSAPVTFSFRGLDIRHRHPDRKGIGVRARIFARSSVVGVSTPQDGACPSQIHHRTYSPEWQRLLSTLYGGRDVAENGGKRQIIFASTGAVTATLRRNWGFEQILRNIIPPEPSESTGKPRTDHRHHAIDAIVIALTRNDVIQAMARASALEAVSPIPAIYWSLTCNRSRKRYAVRRLI